MYQMKNGHSIWSVVPNKRALSAYLCYFVMDHGILSVGQVKV